MNSLPSSCALLTRTLTSKLMRVLACALLRVLTCALLRVLTSELMRVLTSAPTCALLHVLTSVLTFARRRHTASSQKHCKRLRANIREWLRAAWACLPTTLEPRMWSEYLYEPRVRNLVLWIVSFVLPLLTLARYSVYLHSLVLLSPRHVLLLHLASLFAITRCQDHTLPSTCCLRRTRTVRLDAELCGGCEAAASVGCAWRTEGKRWNGSNVRPKTARMASPVQDNAMVAARATNRAACCCWTTSCQTWAAQRPPSVLANCTTTCALSG